MTAVEERPQGDLPVIADAHGNHDTHTMRGLAADLPVRWLNNEIERVENGNIEVLGFENEKHRWPDTLELLAAMDAKCSTTPVLPTMD